MPTPEELEQVQSDNMEAMGFVASASEYGDDVEIEMTDSEREMLEDLGYMAPGEHPSDESRRGYEQAMDAISLAQAVRDADTAADKIAAIRETLPKDESKRRDPYRPGVTAAYNNRINQRRY